MAEKKFWKIGPHLPVKDVRETVEWYKTNLGFTEEWYWGNPVTDGGCRRDELRMLFGLSENFEPAKDLSLVLFVSGIDEVYAEMMERGLEIINPLKTHDYGIREFSIKDCNGYFLRFAESV